MLGSALLGKWHGLRPDDSIFATGREDVDLRDRRATAELIAEVQPDAIIHAAAMVGGIASKLAHPTKYLIDNLLLDSSVIDAAIAAGIPELLYVGSASVYPESYRHPFVESEILGGPLERANEGYAIAKIAGIKMCEYASNEFGLSYRAVVPSNLYGPGDDFSPTHGHLIAAILGKLHRAAQARESIVKIWGDGTARRELTYAPDLAAWLVSQIGRLGEWPPAVNVGVGQDLSVKDYYLIAKDITGFAGEFAFDTSQPAGIHQRLLDSTVARDLGWMPSTTIEDGMTTTYRSYLDTQERRAGL